VIIVGGGCPSSCESTATTSTKNCLEGGASHKKKKDRSATGKNENSAGRKKDQKKVGGRESV